MSTVHLYIIGDVIGVGFRAWVKIQAKINGASGWVRNNFEHADVFGPGGGVEIVIQGKPEVVEKMVELVKTGPPVSRVDDVRVHHVESEEKFVGFEIRK